MLDDFGHDGSVGVQEVLDGRHVDKAQQQGNSQRTQLKHTPRAHEHSFLYFYSAEVDSYNECLQRSLLKTDDDGKTEVSCNMTSYKHIYTTCSTS